MFYAAIPTLYRWLIVAALLALYSFWIYGKGKDSKQADWDAEKAKTAAVVAKVKGQQSQVTTAVDTTAQQHQETVRTVFRDRVLVQTREVPIEVITRQDAGCIVPVRFERLWNSANRAELPDPASLADETPSGITLSDISAQKERETEVCTAAIEQLKDLQVWATAQRKVAP